MHRALTISEVIFEIFSYLPEAHWCLEVSRSKPSGSAGHVTLAALAVTCRIFRDPALAVRWRRLRGLEALLFLFPSDVVNTPACAKPSHSQKLARLPSREEWVRFENYTSYVREIAMCPGADDDIVHALAALSKKYLPCPSQHMFRSLQSFTSHQLSASSLVPILFPPSLRCLDLEFPIEIARQLGVPAMLSLIKDRCTMLTQIRIKGLYSGGNGGDLAAVLRTLNSSFSIPARSIWTMTPSSEEVAYNNRIETLYLEDSIIKDPAAVALILQDLFWSLKNVAVSFTDPHDKSRYDPLWAEVNSRLLLAATRKQEIGFRRRNLEVSSFSRFRPLPLLSPHPFRLDASLATSEY
ncbi:hypothetical protein BJ138DRAFT_1111335 [Hygrophoropsis aurantiaca]|uniref:Uncharacterized protein n=1 Tax=Hygrophoropsis aurantiaca TaxID=72124 RepID=A0ACB8AK18_9AGAM|nr:hypothetical protein BJ138DRAFT_1111335 [Hygrophoropsis aurantiaca]